MSVAPIFILGDLKKILKNAGTKRVIVIFWAEWNKPSKRMLACFSRGMARDDTIVVKADIDRCEGPLCLKFGVISPATCIIFSKDNLIDKYEVRVGVSSGCTGFDPSVSVVKSSVQE